MKLMVLKIIRKFMLLLSLLLIVSCSSVQKKYTVNYRGEETFLVTKVDGHSVSRDDLTKVLFYQNMNKDNIAAFYVPDNYWGLTPSNQLAVGIKKPGIDHVFLFDFSRHGHYSSERKVTYYGDGRTEEEIISTIEESKKENNPRVYRRSKYEIDIRKRHLIIRDRDNNVITEGLSKSRFIDKPKLILPNGQVIYMEYFTENGSELTKVDMSDEKKFPPLGDKSPNRIRADIKFRDLYKETDSFKIDLGRVEITVIGIWPNSKVYENTDAKIGEKFIFRFPILEFNKFLYESESIAGKNIRSLKHIKHPMFYKTREINADTFKNLKVKLTKDMQ